MSEFPLVKLSEVVRFNPRNPDVVPAEADHVTFVPMAAVEAETGRFNGSETREWSAVKKGYTRFQENDVLVAKITPCMENGKACVARHLQGLVGAGSTEFHVLRPITSKVEPEWILRFVNQRCVRHEAKRHMSGAVGQQRVPASFYQDLQLPLPDLKTQQELLERLEDHDVKIDATERALFAIQAKLKQARASILKAAVEGRLIAEGIRTNIECKPYVVKEICLSKPSNGKSVPTGDGFPVLRLTAMKDGRIDVTEIKHGAWTEESARPYVVQQGDFFVMRGSGSLSRVGDAAIAMDAGIKAAFPDTMIRLQPDPRLCHPAYLLLCWRSPDMRTQIERSAKTTAGIYKINQRDISSYRINLPDLVSQRSILEEVERRFSILDQVEATVNASLKRCSQLRQAVLMRVFFFGGGGHPISEAVSKTYMAPVGDADPNL